ncbi:MAG: DUF4411 family protein [Planctomycetota bacterium]
MSRQFLLDANAFIEPKDRYYGFELCPGYWDALLRHHNLGRVSSVDRIENELKAQDDLIKDWIANKAPRSFFKKTQDQAVVDQFQVMVGWVYSEPQFSIAARMEFASVADGWLVAFAKVNDRVVVTHEEYAPGVKRKVPIPNICVEFDVPYVNVFEMLNELGEKFIRSTKRRKN